MRSFLSVALASLLLAGCGEDGGAAGDPGPVVDPEAKTPLCDARGRAPETFASGVRATYLALDETSALWAESAGAHQVVRAAKDGGKRTVLGDAGDVRAVASYGAFVYWLTGDALRGAHKLAGGEVEVPLPSHQNPSFLAADDASLYMIDSGASSAIWTLDGEPHLLASVPFRVTSMAMTDGYVYVASTSQPAGILARVSKKLGEVETVAGLSSPSALVTDDADVFVAHGGSDVRIVAFPREGGDPRTVTTALPSAVVAMARQGQCLYAATTDSLFGIPAAGGPPIELARTAASNIAADEHHVYWTAPDEGAVKRLGR